MRTRVLIHLAAALALTALGCTKAPAAGGCPNNLKSDSKGNCVECLATTDCPAGTYCNSGTCSACSPAIAACQMSGCRGDADCPATPTLQYCSAGACKAGCRADTDCPNGRVCSPTGHQCEAGCTTAHACGGSNQCCSGLCLNVASDASHCGGCDKPACQTGSECCGGGCVDTQNDATHCGGCTKPACPGNDKCVGGQCQSYSGAFALIDVGTNKAGDPSTVLSRQLQALVLVQQGQPQVQGCLAFHYDATHPGADGDAGTVVITNYTGGMATNTSTVPTDIECVRVGGSYHCGYGAASAGSTGPDLSTETFTPDVNPIGAGMIEFKSTGGTDISSFDISAKAGAEMTTTADLTALPFNGTADIAIPYSCGGSCGFTGLPVAIVEATSNDAAHFGDPATTSGRLLCYGSPLSGGPITIDKASIMTVLGTDASIKTVRTSVALLAVTSLSIPKDSVGHNVLPVAGRGRTGITLINQTQ
jgi:hypothetical protein